MKHEHHRSIPPTALKLYPQVVEDWQRALLELARIKGLQRDLPDHDKIKAILKQELKNIRQLWEAFTIDRSQMPRYLLDPKKQSVAYLAGFHLPNVARFQAMLQRIGQQMVWPIFFSQYTSMNIMDWGCGTGALSHAWSDFLKRHKIKDVELSWSLIDQHGAFLDTSKTLLGFQRPSLEVQSAKGRLETLIPRQVQQALGQDSKRLNIVLLGYVWNELQANSRAKRKVEEALLQLSASNCLVFLLEPANQYPARQAMELRESLVENGWLPAYPCPAASSCPMLEHDRDWCYSEFRWQRPQLVKVLDERLEINHERLSSAAYTLVSPTALQAMKEAKWSDRSSIVVGRPTIRPSQAPMKKPSRGGFEYLLCEADGLKKKKPAKDAGISLRGEQLR